MEVNFRRWFLIIVSLLSLSRSTNSTKFALLGNATDLNNRAWVYHISIDKLNANNALRECMTVFGGTLLSISTFEVDELIRIRMQIEGIGSELEEVLTAGRYNNEGVTPPGRWEWTNTATPFTYTKWIEQTPEEKGRCMALIGELSSYGWYSVPCSSAYRFVCQFQI